MDPQSQQKWKRAEMCIFNSSCTQSFTMGLYIWSSCFLFP